MKATGFQYHATPNVVVILAYDSKEKYESGGSFWIAELRKERDDKEPKVTFDDEQFKYIGAKPEEKFGLSEEERRQVYKKNILAERKAKEEAKKEFPLKDNREYPIDDEDVQQSLKQSVLESHLREKYNEKLAEKYGLTYEQLVEIGVEGMYKGWPKPKD